MQRFHRLGSVGLGLIIAAITLHLVAVSLDHWKSITCKTCTVGYYFKEWRSSVTDRCYRISMLNYLNITNNPSDIIHDPFTVYICVPNQYLLPKNEDYTGECLGNNIIGPHNACTSKEYNHTLCKCDYPASTKAILGLTVISSVTLGLMIIVAHFASYIEHDFILKWLIPYGFISLVIAFVCMFVILLLTGTKEIEDVDYIVDWRLKADAYNISSSLLNDTNINSELNPDNFSTALGYSFVIEVFATYFTLISAVIYALMFLAKKRPNA
ncbi:unnamed protein product [Adineta steineri]|uniref:Uncharacterized protein n=1 Tax=Adineta steineri TaxID=433720 RepID=A0A813XDN5_9BILA|nr:unnamed protein product [Adineta steineri]